MTATRQPPFTLRNILEEQSRDLYDASRKYLSFLSVMDKSIVNKDLHKEIAVIAADSSKNIADLEAVCSRLDIAPEGITCEAMAGLLREAKATTQEYESGSVKDAALIANAQRIAHYEIAGFGSAKAFAAQLKLGEIADIFGEMLKRAAASDKALTKIATGSWLSSGINSLAASGE